MKVLVTGGCGFIGSHLVDRLIKEGHEVFVIDSLEKQVHPKKPKYLNPKAKYFPGDLENHPKLEKILKKVEIVFHCASKVGPNQSQTEIYEYMRKNVSATAFLLQKCINSNVKKIIHSSSMALYGQGGKKDIPMREDMPISILSYYGIGKYTQEQMINMFGKVYNIKIISLRYFSVYGSRQTLGNPYAGPIPIFIDKLFKKEQPIIFDDGMQTRDFVHVSDVVNANLLAMKYDGSGTFNIGTGKSTNLLQLCEKICKQINPQITGLITYKHRPEDIRHSLANISKAAYALNYIPKISLDEGLKETIQWARRQNEIQTK